MQLLSNIKSKFFTGNKSLLCVLIAIFIVKGVFYAAFVIPLTMGTSPDDTGHFSYIQYVASQRRLPVHRQTPLESGTLNAHMVYITSGEVIDFVVDEDFSLENPESLNWIVQHPPLYYILMSIAYGIASLFTRQFSHMILILRLANLVFGVASLVFIHKILNELNAKDVVRKCILVFFLFSPALQFFFSTITNDSMLIFVCIFALYYLVKYINSNKMKDFIIFVIGSALIFATKYNGFMVMFTYIGFFIYHSLRYNGFKETVKLSLIGIPIGLAIILPDLLFNFFAAGRIITNDGGLVTGIGAEPAHHYFTFSHFLFRTSYFADITRHIIVWIGARTQITADLFIERLFAIIFLSLSAMHFYKSKSKTNASLILLVGGIVFILFRYAVLTAGFSTGVSLIISCMVMLLCFIVIKTGELDSKERDIHWLFISTLVVMVAVYIYTHFGLLQRHGVLRALHGRYYYIAFFPFAYMLFYQLGEVKSRIVRLAPLALTLVLTIIEFHVISIAFAVW